MAKRVSVDRWLFTVTMLLVFVGLVMVFSASAVMAKERFGSPYTFVLKQLSWAVAGILAMLVAMKIDYRRYKHPGVVFSLLAVTTLLAAQRVSARPDAQHASLDSLERFLVRTVGTCQARIDPVPGVFPGEPHQGH